VAATRILSPSEISDQSSEHARFEAGWEAAERHAQAADADAKLKGAKDKKARAKAKAVAGVTPLPPSAPTDGETIDLTDPWVRAANLRRIAQGRVGDAKIAAWRARNGWDDLSSSISLVRRAAPPAFHGIAGDFVKTIFLHSEASAEALLFQFLVSFGNLMGRRLYTEGGGVRHYGNVYGVLVGDSSKARKGTAKAQVDLVMDQVDSQWRNGGGLSTGEGLIHCVRDPITVGKGDPGVSDKRLMVYEPEFVRVLATCARPENTLSAVIQDAWDRGSMRCTTKVAPETATGAHISIIAHITQEELLTALRKTDQVNGFANRFIFIWTSRSKEIARSRPVREIPLSPIIQNVQGALKALPPQDTYIQFDADGWSLWEKCYHNLSVSRSGTIGGILARSEAQVLRLALIYAALDSKRYIQAEHLHAAMALWDFAEGSAELIFGESTGNAMADKILEALKAEQGGVTRTEITRLLGNNAEKDRIEAALNLLRRGGRAHRVVEPTQGRSTERWFQGCRATN
jgi:Protein of unknown function (DUF3987)